MACVNSMTFGIHFLTYSVLHLVRTQYYTTMAGIYHTAGGPRSLQHTGRSNPGPVPLVSAGDSATPIGT